MKQLNYLQQCALPLSSTANGARTRKQEDLTPSMVPEPGQLVHVRQRPFVVESVLASSGLPDALRQDGLTRSQHLVTLSSIEDDALGDRLRVIWEVEPGASIRERGQLPVPTHGFDDPATLDAFLDAVRWGAISSADT